MAHSNGSRTYSKGVTHPRSRGVTHPRATSLYWGSCGCPVASCMGPTVGMYLLTSTCLLEIFSPEAHTHSAVRQWPQRHTGQKHLQYWSVQQHLAVLVSAATPCSTGQCSNTLQYWSVQQHLAVLVSAATPCSTGQCSNTLQYWSVQQHPIIPPLGAWLAPNSWPSLALQNTVLF